MEAGIEFKVIGRARTRCQVANSFSAFWLQPADAVGNLVQVTRFDDKVKSDTR